MFRSTTFLLLSGIVLIALALRLYTLGDYSIFFDEQSTLLVSQGIALEGANQPELHSGGYFTPQDFWKTKHLPDYYEASKRSDIGNSPAYYFLFHFWVELFGNSDFTIRLFSVLFSVLTIPLVFRFTQKHLKSTNLALFVALVMAIEPFFTAYSHQARNYTMTFFVTLLLTDVFIDIVTSRTSVHWSRFLAYGLLALLAWFCHFLAFIVIAVHGLYVLLYVRDLRVWIGLGASLLIPALGMLWWMTGGRGGDYTLRSLNDQALLYKKIADTQPSDVISPATFKNVWKKLAPVVADQFWISNGLAGRMVGTRNLIVVCIVTLFSGFSLWQYQKYERFRWSIVAIVLTAVSMLTYTIHPFAFLTFQVSILLLGVLVVYIVKLREKPKQHLLVLFAMLTVIPTLFLVLMSVKNGHTFGITQRYAGFSFPYAIILVSIAIRESWKLPVWANVWIGVACVSQLIWISGVFTEIYEDRSPKYKYRSEARIANPYVATAEKIKKLYMPGDTILYPSGINHVYGDADKFTKDIRVSTLVTQIISLYLPKDATYWQRIDPHEPDKVYLWQKSTGKKLLLFDFQGAKYRY